MTSALRVLQAPSLAGIYGGTIAGGAYSGGTIAGAPYSGGTLAGAYSGGTLAGAYGSTLAGAYTPSTGGTYSPSSGAYTGGVTSYGGAVTGATYAPTPGTISSGIAYTPGSITGLTTVSGGNYSSAPAYGSTAEHWRCGICMWFGLDLKESLLCPSSLKDKRGLHTRHKARVAGCISCIVLGVVSNFKTFVKTY